MLLLTDQRPKQTLRRIPIKVPAGHVMPEGTAVLNAFTLTVEVGVRWHPEWDGPKVTGNGWRIFSMGHAIGFAGQDLLDCFGSLLPDDVRKVVKMHGARVDGLNIYGHYLLKCASLKAPAAVEPLSAFILPEQLN